MATVQELFEEYNVDVNILGNMSGVNSGYNHLSQEYRNASQSDESRKAELLKLAPVLENGTLKKSAIVRHVQDNGGRLSASQASKWLMEIVPIVKRKEAAVEAPVASGDASEGKQFIVTELDFYAVEYMKKHKPNDWLDIMKDSLVIIREKAHEELDKKLNEQEYVYINQLMKLADSIPAKAEKSHSESE
ncbi:TPA: hypothetical protein N2N45_002399 [Klebsiella aerogenes]|nr:hypothetical protein [Klebsiella aerogenes]